MYNGSTFLLGKHININQVTICINPRWYIYILHPIIHRFKTISRVIWSDALPKTNELEDELRKQNFGESERNTSKTKHSKCEKITLAICDVWVTQYFFFYLKLWFECLRIDLGTNRDE